MPTVLKLDGYRFYFYSRESRMSRRTFTLSGARS